MMFRIFPQRPNFPFIQWRVPFVTVSALLVLASLISIFVKGFNYGVDFAGGVQMVLRFKPDVDIDSERLRVAMKDMGIDASVQTFGTDVDRLKGSLVGTQDQNATNKEFIIQFGGDFIEAEYNQKVLEASFRDLEKEKQSVVTEFRFSGMEKAYFRVTQDLTQDEVEKRVRATKFSPLELESVAAVGRSGQHEYELHFKSISLGVAEKLNARFKSPSGGESLSVQKVDFVGSRVGSDLKTSAILSILITLAAIFLYIFIRFDLEYAPGAVLALAHDVLVTAGIFSFLDMEMDLTVVAALLTIAGYSINDTIIIFDRIRSARLEYKGKKLDEIMNLAVNQTLSRTVITAFCVLISVTILWLTGGPVIHGLAFALVFGTVIGSYSSIFVASPLALWTANYLENQKKQTPKKVVAA